MLLRITLMSLSCLAVASCSANANVSTLPKVTEHQLNLPENGKQISQQIADTKENIHSLKTADLSNSVTQQQKQNKYPSQIISTGIINPVTVGGYMTLTPTGQTNNLNNPLYELSLYVDGQLVDKFITVSGRTYTQNRNRHQSGTEAPLPDGRYKVAKGAIRGTIAEAGDRFLPIQPLFKTGRTALGFHVDPSFNKNNGEDGTSGCIGLVARGDLDRLLSFVRTHQPQFIDVKIQ